MVIETEILPFLQWLPLALVSFAQTAFALVIIALIGGYLIAALRHGPLAGGDATYQVIAAGFNDLLLNLSPRRIGAMTWLAVQEAMRRKVLVVFAVFLGILLFAGWYLDKNSSREPAKIYLTFVLNATMYLILLLALFLSVFSLPNDIKNRTIYTIVTKPVRPGEIVLGRIFGFTIVGTVMLLAMALSSYLFVIRAVNHTHEIRTLSDSQEMRTTTTHGHRHDVFESEDGRLSTDFKYSHWHEVTSPEENGTQRYQVNPPQGMLVARVPVYGKLRFFDRAGRPAERGINTGSEWTYRSYIEGASQSKAIWTFTGLSEDMFPRDQFPDGVPLELTLRVFRTYKGNIEETIPGSVTFRNPTTGQESSEEVFSAKEFYVDRRTIPFDLEESDTGAKLDLFKDLVDSDGRLEVIVRCIQPAQYFGMAQADVYIKAANNSFFLNFLKGFTGIWTQMVLVISFGVMFSTVLNSPVALVTTLSAIVVGFFTDQVVGLAQHDVIGGGPVEAFIRIVTHENLIIKLEDNLATRIAQMLDSVLLFGMQGMAYVLPDFRTYDKIDYVSQGFDIPADIIFQLLVSCMAYVFGTFIAGYFLLKTREVAK